MISSIDARVKRVSIPMVKMASTSPGSMRCRKADQNRAHCPCTAASTVNIPVRWVGGGLGGIQAATAR